MERARVLTGRLGRAVRDHGTDSPQAQTLRRRIAASKIDQSITDALAAAGGPLMRDDAEELAARVKGASR